MTVFATDTLRCRAAVARSDVSTANGRCYWYGYFMSGVPAAMS